MKLCQLSSCLVAASMLAGIPLFAADPASSNVVVSTPAVYVPDTSHENDPLPAGYLGWDNTTKEVTVPVEDNSAHFSFSLTNISSGQLAILDVHPSCGCTTAQVPSMPWVFAPGNTGQFGVTVNLAAKFGTMVQKSVTVRTDKGSTLLILKMNLLQARPGTLSDAERVRDQGIAKINRQSIFRNDCGACHVTPGMGKFGKPLYDTACAICHEGEKRAPFVPDLHTLKVATNLEFWRTWIIDGKAGTMMPAFALNKGGSLNNVQIDSLANFLAASIPSAAPAHP